MKRGSSMATFEPKITRIEPPTSVQSKIKSGRELAKRGRTEEALAEFETALKLDPNSKFARLGSGALKARLDRLDEALSDFKEVLRLDPMNVQAHLRSSRVLILKKEMDKAQEYAESALRIDPKAPLGYLLLGYIYLSRKDLTKAKEHFSMALVLSPRLVRARIQMALVLRDEGKLLEALAQLNAAARIEPDNDKVHDFLGKLHLVRKDFVAAREAFDKAIALRPESEKNNIETLFGLAEALMANGELDRAEETLRKLPSRIEGRPGLHKLWGDLYEQRGLYPEAVEEYRAAQLIAEQDAGASPMPLKPSPLPALDDLEPWKELAASLKKNTDAYKEELRFRTAAPPVEIDD
jgi:tetratricopeptide (TPR) repeat protein